MATSLKNPFLEETLVENRENRPGRLGLKPAVRVAPPTAPVQSQKVKVVLRVRPFLPSELGPTNNASCVAIKEDQATISNPRNQSEGLVYQFDGCFGEETSQTALFTHCVAPVLPDLFKGINTTVFAYGNTGAGKTFTMEGDKESPGIIPQAVDFLFRFMQQRPELSNELTISFMEIYNEKVYDLLVASENDLSIREDQHKNILIPSLSSSKVRSFGEFERLWNAGRKQRSTAATKLNPNSSRSHSILLIQVDPKLSDVQLKDPSIR